MCVCVMLKAGGEGCGVRLGGGDVQTGERGMVAREGRRRVEEECCNRDTGIYTVCTTR